MTALETWLTLLALGGVSVLTRGFFFLSNRPWQLPPWAERGLHYAPIAALAAVVVPDVLATQGVWLHTWQDARLWGAVAGVAWAVGPRGGVLGTIVCGMSVFLPLRLALGW